MYYDTLIKLPDGKGKYTYDKKNGVTYVRYTFEEEYLPDKKYYKYKRCTIGRLSSDDNTMIIPNENFMKYFPELLIENLEDKSNRSCCLHIGCYAVLKKIIKDYDLETILSGFFEPKNVGLFLDLALYAIITEDNVGQYYPDYAYNHPLLTPNMKIYSDATVSKFINEISCDDSVTFLNQWNSKMDHRDKVYISYDSTNKNSKAGDVDFVEYGKPKIDVGDPIFNVAIGYDIKKRELLYYEAYSGSVVDVTQFKYMINKAKGYGYQKIAFIIDRGYFSKDSFKDLDDLGYDFIVMVRGRRKLIENLIDKYRGTFEEDRDCDMDGFGVYGKTFMRKLFEDDINTRYLHLFYSASKYSSERVTFENNLREIRKYLEKQINTEYEISEEFGQYFEGIYQDKTLLMIHEKKDVTSTRIKRCGYFLIATSEKMTAKEALHIYKSRDFSEKAFRGDKSYLGDKSMRVHSTESTQAKIFIEFVAMIIRNKFYTSLSDEQKRNDKHSNYMTVPAAIKELEKIEMSRQTDGIYRIDHAVTARQKAILKAFNMTVDDINVIAREISDVLKPTTKYRIANYLTPVFAQ